MRGPDRAGVYYGASTSVAPDCADEEVYVIGGANSASQAAMFLSRTAKSVTIVSRRGLEDSMSHYLVQQIRSRPNIREMPNTVVHAVQATGTWSESAWKTSAPANVREHASGRMFIFIGAEPRTDWLGGGGARRPRIHPGGPDLREVSGWMLDRPPPPGNKRARRVRCR